MAVGSPHVYTANAPTSVSSKTVRNALTQAQPLARRGLPPILTLRHLADLTGVEYRYLRNIVARRRDSYRTFQIRKHQGGRRLICVPEPQLLLVQRWLGEAVLSRIAPHPSSFAYAPGNSPLRCAREHAGCRWLMKIDLRRFFESITEIRIFRIFRELGYQALVAFELARICTRDSRSRGMINSSYWQVRPKTGHRIPAYSHDTLGHLPQGAPTSPMLANLAARPLDTALTALADSNELVYTRYSDDLVFSTASFAFNRSEATRIIRIVYSQILHEAFEPHTAKTVIVPPGARKIVLGLLVDREQPRLTRQFRSRLLEHSRCATKFGLLNHISARRFDSIWGFVRHVEGLLAFAESVEPHFAQPVRNSFHRALEASGWLPPLAQK
jgi:RNA-directed DNA polymerase